MLENLSNIIINKYNGNIVPLYFKDDKTCGTGLCNPSILVEGDKIRLYKADDMNKDQSYFMFQTKKRLVSV